MKKTCVVTALVLFFVLFSGFYASAEVNTTWKLKDVRKVENNPKLSHFIWEIYQPPYSELDKITLHRVVLISRILPEFGNKHVIMMLPGTWNAGGWSEITDPNINTMLFLANKGYDVYTIDYRTANLPDMGYSQFCQYGVDIAGTADWTDGVFRDDVKSCVDKIKQLSRAEKIFMGGFSRGGTLMYIYASKYQEDLRGLVSLDGGIKDFPPAGTALDEATYNQRIELFKQGLFADPYTGMIIPWLSGIYGLTDQSYADWKLAGVLPYTKQLVGQPLPSEYNTIADYVAVKAHHLWDFFGLGEGLLANYESGNIDRDVLIKVLNEFHHYAPYRQFIEEGQMAAWANVPYLDYDDNAIYLPTAAYLSKLMCPNQTCNFSFIPNMTKSSDVTIKFLDGYGHMDVLFGKNSLIDVKQPLLEWLNNHLN